MKKLLALSVLWVSVGGAAVIVSPVAVVSNSGGEFLASTGIGNTINHSNLSVGFLSGTDDYDAYLGLNPVHSGTFSGIWWSASGNTSSTIVYDLGSSMLVDNLAIWQGNANEITSFTLLASEDSSFATSTNLGTFNLVFLSAPTAAQQFGFTATSARYFSVAVTNATNGASLVQMGEIAFRVDPTAGVPEPTTTALAVVGLGVLFYRRRMR